MHGKASHAQKLTSHLGRQIDAACMINKPGSTATLALAGVAGAAARAAVSRKTGPAEIGVLRNGWLAVGPESFSLVTGDRLVGNPKGDPFAVVDFEEVEAVELKRGRITWRADVALMDGRTLSFETKSKGVNKPNPEVFELLAQRCS